jgi:tRNA-Thr(GGU) m(6)t(6)A37 methyltransferase TsaA
MEGYSHLWLIWGFSENKRNTWASTVKPPRLGGNKRMGVFATRSPYRPNSLGLSSVELVRVEQDEKLGPVLVVTGADLMDGTPIYDVKPYLPFTDSHPEARGGFADDVKDYALEVVFPEEWLQMIPADKREGLFGILAQDPRPSYQDDPDRVYGMGFAGLEVRFRVEGEVLTVTEIDSAG